ncbi:MAG TPA: hypothetical protein VKX41_15990 [Alloacidobacterium sp.]|nr:hypothetical protein [Alloacidobacterium sp.]
MTGPAHQQASDDSIEQMVSGLDSLVDGDRAAEQLISLGQRVVPAVERFLVESRPRSISVSRCRAVRILGALGAYSSLTCYLRENIHPSDATVLFAEDAVRSAAARELMRHESPTTFRVLLDATKQRPTGGLIQALSQYRWPECVPLLFDLLEDDLCREDAKEGLRRVPEAAKAYAILLLRGRTQLPVQGYAASSRRRATLQLLVEFGIGMNEWPDLRAFLKDEDRDCVISAATLGLSSASPSERPSIIAAMLESSAGMNWAQETEAIELLDKWPSLARQVAREFRAQHEMRRERPNWLSPFWRILHHVLGSEMQGQHPGGG